MKIVHVEDYAKLRREAYPDVGDQLDAMWKMLANVNPKTPEAQAMLDQVAAVKTKYPKPE